MQNVQQKVIIIFFVVIVASFLFLSSSESVSNLSRFDCPQIQTDCMNDPPGCSSGFGIYDPSICKCVCHSSSSSGEIMLSKNFTGTWKGRVERIKSSSSSSSGECIICTQVVPECSADQTLIPQSCNECAHCISPSFSNSSGSMSNRILEHIDSEKFGSSIITFKLCVKDGKLEGIVQEGGVFINGKIISQNVISENEVEITAESKDGKTTKIKLKFISGREFLGTFEDGHEFTAKKLNSRASCHGPRN